MTDQGAFDRPAIATDVAVVGQQPPPVAPVRAAVATAGDGPLAAAAVAQIAGRAAAGVGAAARLECQTAFVYHAVIFDMIECVPSRILCSPPAITTGGGIAARNQILLGEICLPAGLHKMCSFHGADRRKRPTASAGLLIPDRGQGVIVAPIKPIGQGER